MLSLTYATNKGGVGSVPSVYRDNHDLDGSASVKTLPLTIINQNL